MLIIKGPTNNWKLFDVQNCWLLKKTKNVEIRRPKCWIHEKFLLHKGKWWRWLHNTHAYVIFDSQCGCVVGTCFLELWFRSTNSHCVGAATSYKGEKKRGRSSSSACARRVFCISPGDGLRLALESTNRFPSGTWRHFYRHILIPFPTQQKSIKLFLISWLIMGVSLAFLRIIICFGWWEIC